MVEKALGILLIIIAIILAVAEHSYHFYGRDNEWYFYGLAVVIAIIGIILIAWGYMKPSPKTPEAPGKT
jgi:surface polysaccharide O-acyltransferase-like enzyme